MKYESVNEDKHKLIFQGAPCVHKERTLARHDNEIKIWLWKEKKSTRYENMNDKNNSDVREFLVIVVI